MKNNSIKQYLVFMNKKLLIVAVVFFMIAVLPTLPCLPVGFVIIITSNTFNNACHGIATSILASIIVMAHTDIENEKDKFDKIKLM